MNANEIGERSTISFFTKTPKKIFALWYKDKNDKIRMQIVYENDIMLQKITVPVFLWKTV